MTGLILDHKLLPGTALDRRRVEELYAQVAQRMSVLDHLSIGDNKIRRSQFRPDAWTELRFTSDDDLQFLPVEYGFVVAGGVVSVLDPDRIGAAAISWSMHAVHDTNSRYLYVWPVYADQVLIGGFDAHSSSQQVRSTYLGAGNPPVDPTNTASLLDGELLSSSETASLGGTGYYTGNLLQASVSLLCFGSGKFTVTRATVGQRRVLR